MKDVRIRLLYPASIRQEEVRAALSGMERFRTYGVLHDGLEITSAGSADLKGLRNARTMKWLLTSGSPAVTCVDLNGGLADFLFGRRIIPIGLTPSRISELASDEFSTKIESRLGLSLEGEGAIISLFRAREMAARETGGPGGADGIQALSLESIRMAVIHEVGHVLGIKGHCEKEGCVMQGNNDFEDFIERFVKAGADFCGRCSGIVRSTVCRMSMGA